MKCVEKQEDNSLKFQRLLWFLLFFTLLSIACLFIWTKIHPVKNPLPVYGQVPAFSLVDQSGKTVDLESLKGQIWIVDFIFTRCGGQCPFMNEKMKEIRKELPSQIKSISISVDPENDTSDVLQQYVQKQEIDTTQWLFLTGDKDSIFRLAREGFHLGVEEGGDVVEPIMHSNRFIVVDQKAQIRGIYSVAENEAMKRLIQDVKSLLDAQK